MKSRTKRCGLFFVMFFKKISAGSIEIRDTAPLLSKARAKIEHFRRHEAKAHGRGKKSPESIRNSIVSSSSSQYFGANRFASYVEAIVPHPRKVAESTVFCRLHGAKLESCPNSGKYDSAVSRPARCSP
jgi:hypothetical protein